MISDIKVIALLLLSSLSLYLIAASLHHWKPALWIFCLSLICAGAAAQRISRK